MDETMPCETSDQRPFENELLNKISFKRPCENVLYSPASIQSILTLIYYVASGNTAKEMQEMLRLGDGNKFDIAEKNYDLFKVEVPECPKNNPELEIINRVYLNQRRFEMVPSFKEIAVNKFFADIELVPFGDSYNTVNKINTWIEEKSAKKFKNLLSYEYVNTMTDAILVNTIYFKGTWEKQFLKRMTHKADFIIDECTKVKVDMMYLTDQFKYAELPELDAKAVELPYEDSEMSMLIIVPTNCCGLETMLRKLRDANLKDLTSTMAEEEVDVIIPKFRIEFDIDLKRPLRKLGICSIFSHSADFSCLYPDSQPFRISEVKHRALINVNEGGSERKVNPALQFMFLKDKSPNPKSVRADHPFVFMIRNKDAIFFIGHVVEL